MCVLQTAGERLLPVAGWNQLHIWFSIKNLLVITHCLYKRCQAILKTHANCNQEIVKLEKIHTGNGDLLPSKRCTLLLTPTDSKNWTFNLKAHDLRFWFALLSSQFSECAEDSVLSIQTTATARIFSSAAPYTNHFNQQQQAASHEYLPTGCRIPIFP